MAMSRAYPHPSIAEIIFEMGPNIIGPIFFTR